MKAVAESETLHDVIVGNDHESTQNAFLYSVNHYSLLFSG
jgi:hypothetical protein